MWRGLGWHVCVCGGGSGPATGICVFGSGPVASGNLDGWLKTRGLRRGRAAPQGELDELEREEFFRLKKVQSNKKKHAEAAASQEARLVSCLPAACGARRSASPLAVL